MKTLREMHILIVGAGIAGLTAAALLQKEGAKVTVIEKDSGETYNTSGYMLGLLPLGGRVLNALGLQKEYYSLSVEMEHYVVHKGSGEVVHDYPLDFIRDTYGSYRGIERSALIDLLLTSIEPNTIRFGQEIDTFHHKENCVEVTHSDGNISTYDLIIGADGMHSKTRKQLLKPHEYEYYETGWGGWIGWVEGKDHTSYHDYWGTSLFMGLYPVKEKIGVFIGASKSDRDAKGLKGLIQEAHHTLHAPSSVLLEALETLSKEEEPYF